MKKFKWTMIGLAMIVVAIAFGANIKDNLLTVGDLDNSVNKQINMGAGALKWDGASGKMQVSNDQAVFIDIGSGAGGGTGGINILSNTTAETGNTDGWNFSGSGSFSVTSITAEVGFGGFSYELDGANSGDSVESTLTTIPNGLRGTNCLARMFYSVDNSDYDLEVSDGTAVLASISLPTTNSQYRGVEVSFVCPSSGSLQFNLVQNTGGDPNPIFYDNVFLGENFTVGQVSQAERIGTLTYNAASSCIWAGVSGSFADFPADTDCNDTTLTGDAKNPTTVVPGIRFTNLQPGKYEVIVQGQFRTGDTATACVFRITSGAQSRGRLFINTQDDSESNLIGSFEFDVAQADITFQVQQIRIGGAANCEIDNDTTTVEELHFTVKRFPLSSQTAIRADQSGWFISTQMGSANVALNTSPFSGEVIIENGNLDLQPFTGSAQVEIPCNPPNAPTGLTCSTGSEQVGIAFTPPAAGKYEVCIRFVIEHDQNGGNAMIPAFVLHETSETSTAIIQNGSPGTVVKSSGASNTNNIDTMEVCHVFDFNSVAKRVIRLMYEVDGSAGTTHSFLTDQSPNQVGRAARFTV